MTVVIGDIHGGYRALKQLLELSKLPKNTKYVFVGDYVDGWSESAEVISYLMEFSKMNTCIFIKGNHDDLLYRYLKYGESNPKWISEGGQSSMESYSKLSREQIQIHLTFFENLVTYHIDEQNRLFVHAGFANLNGPDFEYYSNTVYWDRTLWEMVCAMDSSIHKSDMRYPKRLKLYKEIFIGHTPVTRVGFEKPANFANVWNVDTGAAFKGRISMMDVNSKEIYQSEPVFELYPNENGRN